jgi:hypothetical protein
MDVTLAGVAIGALGAFIAFAGVALAWYTGRKTARSAEEQNRLTAHATAAEWLRDLRNWASEAIDVLSESSYLCRQAGGSEDECTARLHSCQHKLSSLIDRGRLFLPNLPAEVGLDKPTAYRGWRHSALDPLVAALRVASGEVGSGRFPSRDVALVEMRREFVSAIQSILAPDVHNREIVQLVKEWNAGRGSDLTLGGLLPGKNVMPTGADRLIWGESRTSSD